MIVKDEEDVIARSINCALTVADEVIVVDTGSSDGSKKIAADLGAKVYDFEWCDDFSAARNYSFSLASGDYVMWLDADDIIEEQSAQLIKELVSAGGFDVAMLKYVSGNLTYYRERILRRAMDFVWKGAVHEVIAPRGKVIYSPARIVPTCSSTKGSSPAESPSTNAKSSITAGNSFTTQCTVRR